jgi:peptide/nickel transport system substrate-binding protein
MTIAATWLTAGVLIVLASAAAAAPPTEEEAPAKRGGMLTYMIPADAPPSFDGHREATFATLRSHGAPFTVC